MERERGREKEGRGGERERGSESKNVLAAALIIKILKQVSFLVS